MTTINWRIAGENGETRSDEVDLGPCRHVTVDGMELAASVAKAVFDQNVDSEPGWQDYSGGDGPVLDILSPEDFAGRFAVSASKTTRKDGVTVTGTLARRLTVMTEEEKKAYIARIAEFTPSDVVETAYEFLGNRYGHEIHGALNHVESAEISALESGYLNGRLHDLGWPVRCKTSGHIGFLADTTHWDREPFPDDDALKRFREETDCVAQPVSRWQGRDVSFLVAFVPASEGSAKASMVAERLADLVRPEPDVIPRR